MPADEPPSDAEIGDQGRFLNRLSELRKQADYGYGPIEEDVDRLLATTRTFVDDMSALVEHD